MPQQECECENGYFSLARFKGSRSILQINLYLLSRILYALVQLCAERGYLPRPQSPDPGQPAAFPWFAAVVWGVVLWLFEYHKPHLQPSLQSSMTYLYHDSNKFNNVRNFVIYNK